MKLLAIGRLKPGPEAEILARYLKRLRPKLDIVELPEATGAPAEIKRREAEALLAALPAGAFLVALDLGPPAPGSEAFARLLEGWSAAGRKIVFVIGGAEGLDASVVARADHILSLGPLTWPHMLVRIMLAEQIYRAQAINSGHPYHRSGRP